MARVVLLASAPLSDANEVVMELSQDAVARLALELALQLEGLTDSVQLAARSGQGVVLTLGDGQNISKARVERTGKRILFELGRNQLEYVQAFLLRAYREEAAEVNHLHVEGVDADASFDLTLMFEVFQEPMSSEEARRLMDE